MTYGSLGEERGWGVVIVDDVDEQVTKTVADKLLKEIENSGQIMGKSTKGKDKDGKDIAGSQWVFWCKQVLPLPPPPSPTQTELINPQDPADAATPEELAGMDTTITSLRNTIPPKKAELKVLTAKLNMVMSAPTTGELACMIERLRGENEARKEKLGAFKEAKVKQVSKEDVERVEREFRYWGIKRKARKEAFLGLEGMLLVGMTKEEIWERAGIESEEL
jgi:26S proteasome regulatory subunit (ATPase 3-interacting protein)